MADAGTLAQYTGTWTYTAAVPKPVAANTFDIESGPATVTSMRGDDLVLEEAATCAGVVGGGITLTPVTSSAANAAVLVYTLETASGNYDLACTTVQ